MQLDYLKKIGASSCCLLYFHLLWLGLKHRCSKVMSPGALVILLILSTIVANCSAMPCKGNFNKMKGMSLKKKSSPLTRDEMTPFHTSPCLFYFSQYHYDYQQSHQHLSGDDFHAILESYFWSFEIVSVHCFALLVFNFTIKFMYKCTCKHEVFE